MRPALALAVFIVLVTSADAALARGGRGFGGFGGHSSHSSHSTKSAGQDNPTGNYTPGYTRKDGTRVSGYRATNPNDTVRDNYSYRGNAIPYTGRIGTGPFVPTSPYAGPGAPGRVGPAVSSAPATGYVADTAAYAAPSSATAPDTPTATAAPVATPAPATAPPGEAAKPVRPAKVPYRDPASASLCPAPAYVFDALNGCQPRGTRTTVFR
jgi:hypothetical protein